MQHFHFMVSLIYVAVVAAEDFFTGSDLPPANGFDLLPPSLDQSPLDPVIPDLLNEDLLNPFDSSGINLEVFDGGGADSEWIASVPDECWSPPFRSRRRNTLCTVSGDKPYFEDFRGLADQTSQKVSNFDERSCLGPLPYFVCSSNSPLYSIYSPKLLSWVLFQSSRVGNDDDTANCVYPSELYCCGAWYPNSGMAWIKLNFFEEELGVGTACSKPGGYF